MRNIEPNEVYIQCAAYNLNRVVKEVIVIKTFFEIVQQIYNFFADTMNMLSIFIEEGVFNIGNITNIISN